MVKNLLKYSCSQVLQQGAKTQDHIVEIGRDFGRYSSAILPAQSRVG